MDRARSIDQSEVPASALGLTAPSSVRSRLFPRWEELIASCGEGMVVKPLEFVTKGRKGLANLPLRNCVTKCGAFRGRAQPNLILPMKCCDSFSGLDAHHQVLKGAPVRDSTTIVSESDLARQLNTVKPLRSHPLYCFAARGQARHASKSGRLLGSTLSMHG
jgi:hypothetical protein